MAKSPQPAANGGASSALALAWRIFEANGGSAES